jgi:hypothetical protein
MMLGRVAKSEAGQQAWINHNSPIPYASGFFT